MRRRRTQFVLVPCLLVVTGLLVAQGPPPSFTGHYPVGIEGIKAGSVPPPGTYIRDYNVFYYSNDLPDGPSNFDLFAYIHGFRLIWITPLEILGANYGFDFILPFGYTQLEAGPFDGSAFRLGDIAIEPVVLAWHVERFDLAVGYAFWAPSGAHDDPTDLGKGFWSNMFSAGGTWYPDEKKTWAASLLGRYELHEEHVDLGITPGDTLSLEWGISKTLWGNIDVGLVGYLQQQTTTDRGAGSTDVRDSVVGLGPEVSAMFPQWGLFLSLRYVREIESRDRPEGNTFTFTLTKAF